MTVATDGSGERPRVPRRPFRLPRPRRPPGTRPNPDPARARAAHPTSTPGCCWCTFDGAAAGPGPRPPPGGRRQPLRPTARSSPTGAATTSRATAARSTSLPVDGSAGPTQLTDVAPGIDADPIWSPDGAQIAFRARDRRRRAPGHADGRRRLGRPAADRRTGYWTRTPAWSPDGARIAFKSDRPPAIGPVGEHVWIVDSSGGEATQLDDQGYTAPIEPAWGPR